MPTSRNLQTTNTSPTTQPDLPFFGTRMTEQEGGYGSIGADSAAAGNLDTAADRVRQIFVNRDVGIGTDNESEQERIARIANEIVSGERTFGDVRRSVDRIGQSADQTRASAGLAPVTQPQLSPEMVQQLNAERAAARSAFGMAEADALEARAEAEFNADLQMERLLEQFDMRRRGQMDAAGDVGMAFQPAGAGRAMRDTGQAEARETGELTARLDFQLEQLAERVAQARRERDARLAELEEREQSMRSALVRDELAQFGAI